jgi:ABC-2 type transport system ATP-binding protein
VSEAGLQSAYFPSREAAQAAGAARRNGFTLRRVNLEDAFLTLTGKKVATDANAQTVHGQGHGAHAAATHNPTGGYAKKGD